MKKVRLDILGLSYSQTQVSAYTLVLGETKGKRRMPIIIGGFEAQAIAIQLEKITPSRPLTHDLFKNFADIFNIKLKEVIIYNLAEGVFFSKLICSNGEKEIEIDARTSDAIALAVRFECMIFTYEFILASAGIVLEDNPEPSASSSVKNPDKKTKVAVKKDEGDIVSRTTEELKDMLKSAIDAENYERASIIRDELSKREKT
ncbi:MAG: bifunctional nuclease family protein [Bacteroidota bacterium]